MEIYWTLIVKGAEREIEPNCGTVAFLAIIEQETLTIKITSTVSTFLLFLSAKIYCVLSTDQVLCPFIYATSFNPQKSLFIHSALSLCYLIKYLLQNQGQISYLPKAMLPDPNITCLTARSHWHFKLFILWHIFKMSKYCLKYKQTKNKRINEHLCS